VRRTLPSLLTALWVAALPACARAREPVVLWLVANTHGTVAPCGCTSDPLGGLDRLAARIRAERGPSAVVQAGDLERDPAAPADLAKAAEAAARASLLRETFSDLGLWKPGVHELGGLKIAVVDRIDAPPPADLVIALLDLPRAEARRKLRQAHGIDLAVVGGPVGEVEAVPERAGEAWLFEATEQLQRVVRVELHVPRGAPARPLAYAGGPGDLEKLDDQIAALEGRLAGWRSAKDADAAFVAERERELSDLRTERTRVAQRPVHPPAQGSWFTSALLPIRQRLPSDARVHAQMAALDRRLGEENRKRDCAQPAPAPVEPRYVGVARCGEAGCHPKAVATWRTTVHAHAWKTLVDDGRAFSHDCFGCHVTGAGEPARGGATLCKPEPLVDVQCEVCHGPASAHVAAGGLEDPPSVVRRPAEDLCATRCHTPQHSDTFDRTAYLRDVLGPGHGEKTRAALGPGPTGHELRQAALRRAGRAP
jgi:hypothetical protein